MVSCGIYYPLKALHPLVTASVALHQMQDIDTSAGDGFLIKGSLCVIAKGEEIILTANLYYGYHENPAMQNHFDGTLAIFGDTPPDPPAPPDYSPGSDFPDEINVVSPLFPYIYLEPWPAVDEAQLRLHFVRYQPATDPPDSLYQRMKAASLRQEKITLCVAFLNADPSFKDQYYSGLQDIPFPFNIFPSLYDQLTDRIPPDVQEYRQMILSLTGQAAEEVLQLPIWAEVQYRVWQNYFALVVINGFHMPFLVELNKILLILHLIEWLVADLPVDPEHLDRLLTATIILPEIFPLPPAETQQDSAIQPYAVGRLNMVKYQLCRYQAGEIARMENVLKGECKKLLHRQRHQQQEHTSEHTLHQQTDAADVRETTQDLFIEARKTLADYIKKTTYQDFKTTYGPPTVATLNGSWQEEITPVHPEMKDTDSFAKAVLNKTLHRINEQVSRKRSFVHLQEEEDVSVSVIDNRQATTHLRAIYRWVNKVYRIHVENCGCRFLLEINIDRPAAAYIASQQTLNGIDLRAPKTLKEQQVLSYKDITEDNYAALATEYGLTDILLPPEEEVDAAVLLKPGETEKYVQVPAGYAAREARVSAVFASDTQEKSIAGLVSSYLFSLKSGDEPVTIHMGQETGLLPVAAAGVVWATAGNDYIITAKITCELLAGKKDEWKTRVYQQLSLAYEKRQSAYIEELSRMTKENDAVNPLLLRQIEQSVLRQACTGLLQQVAVSNEGQSAFTADASRYQQFFAEALEWQEMSYLFSDAPAAFSYALQGRDDSLRPFLQAATARVFIPVHPAFNFQFLYFLGCGALWNGRWPFVPLNDTQHNRRTALLLQQVQQTTNAMQPVRSWELSLPTTMQVIQESNQLPSFIDH